MRSFSTLALLLPTVLAAPLKSTTHHQHSSSCIIAGVAYPDPHHTLVLLGRRELHPPTGLSERAFTDFLLFCHESGGRSSSSSHVARQQGSYLSNALEDPAGSDSMLGTTTPGGAPQPPASGDQRDQSASSSAASSPSTTPATTASPGSDSMLDTTTPGDAPQPPASGDQRDQSASSSTASSSPSTTSATTTSPTPSPSETPGPGSATGPTSTGTSAGNETPETLANPVGSPPSGDTAAIIPADNDPSHDPNLSETPLAQSDSSAFDTPFTTTPEGVTAGFYSSFVDSNVSDSFGDISGSSISDVSNSLDDASNDDEGKPVTMGAQSGV
ncbi:hypothetical protein DFJ58DRAFT_744499 [Suillus subalutaceus]|uniref:uncharacterized protein n=1 Tax=Suillus subalutaceus TaxID=48586 RepID=UPI001B866B4A|nr:uncharacterized protein DFJ58DRAFT_744499 [Suillus subalutaceus]KAG1860303.1 hypothetical protein DFJ58DRAFT_744499 [Suillus subalutaceus]